jgi:hypothetical protein
MSFRRSISLALTLTMLFASVVCHCPPAAAATTHAGRAVSVHDTMPCCAAPAPRPDDAACPKPSKTPASGGACFREMLRDAAPARDRDHVPASFDVAWAAILPSPLALIGGSRTSLSIATTSPPASGPPTLLELHCSLLM